jgi:hypothetical protein
MADSPYDNFGGDYGNYTTGQAQDTASPSYDPNYGSSTGSTDWAKLLGTLGTTAAAAALGQSNVNRTTSDRDQLQNDAITNLQNLAASLRDSSANPDLQQYVNNAARAVQLGTLQPAQALAAVQQQTQLHGIQVPQEYKDAVNSSLAQLDTVSKNGYTDIEKAAIQKALNQSLVQSRGDIGELQTNAQEQGQYGTGSKLVSQQMAAQAAANTNAQSALDIQAAGLTRALAALSAKGTLGLQASDQSFNQQKTIASAQDQINQQNAALQQQANEQNAARAQQAALTNNQNAYAVQNTNIAQSNLEQDRARAAAQAEFDNAQKQKEDAAAAQIAAGRNAASILSPAYQQQQAAQTAQNQQAGNLLSGSNLSSLVGGVGSALGNVPWGSIGSGISDAASGIGSAIGDLFSDERVKDNKRELSDDDLDSIFDQLVPTQFTYKKSVRSLGAPTGPVTGVMAQDLEKTPQGAMIVIDTPAGKKLDGQKALSLALAGLASMNNRVKELEGSNGTSR